MPTHLTVVVAGIPAMAAALDSTGHFAQVFPVTSTAGLKKLLQSQALSSGVGGKVFIFADTTPVDTPQSLSFLIGRLTGMGANVVIVAASPGARELVNACPGAGLLEGPLKLNQVLGALSGLPGMPSLDPVPHNVDIPLPGEEPAWTAPVSTPAAAPAWAVPAPAPRAQPAPAASAFPSAPQAPAFPPPVPAAAVQPRPAPAAPPPAAPTPAAPVAATGNPFGGPVPVNPFAAAGTNPFGGAEPTQAAPAVAPQQEWSPTTTAPRAAQTSQWPSQPAAEPVQYEPAQYEPAQYEPTQYQPAQYEPAQQQGPAAYAGPVQPPVTDYNSPAAPSPFGGGQMESPVPGSFAPVPSVSPFGAPASPFGQAPSVSPFGAPANPGSYGAQPTLAPRRRIDGTPGGVLAPPTKRARVITVTAPKGGTGKSTLSLNLAAYLGLRLRGTGKTVCIIDANVQQADTGKYLNKYTPNIESILKDPTAVHPDRIMNYLLHKPELNLSALLGPATPEVANPLYFTGRRYKLILDALRPHFDYILIDTPVAELYHDLFREFALPEADFIVVTIAPNVATLMNTDGWLRQVTAPKNAEGMGIDPEKIGIVLNRAQDDIGLSEEEVRRELGSWRFLAAVPETKEWQRCNNQGVLVATKNYHELNQAFQIVLAGATGDEMLATTGAALTGGRRSGSAGAGSGLGGKLKKMLGRG
jgi:MinD-like ATPase involved in chromosome partitioning or flagellar assembly